ALSLSAAEAVLVEMPTANARAAALIKNFFMWFSLLPALLLSIRHEWLTEACRRIAARQPPVGRNHHQRQYGAKIGQTVQELRGHIPGAGLNNKRKNGYGAEEIGAD